MAHLKNKIYTEDNTSQNYKLYINFNNMAPHDTLPLNREISDGAFKGRKGPRVMRCVAS